MKFSSIRYCFTACAFAVVLVVAVVAGASDIAEVVGKACTKCHSSKRICLNLGVKSASAWQGTVKKMVGKGAKVPTERVDEAATYLANLDPGAAPFCD